MKFKLLGLILFMAMLASSVSFASDNNGGGGGRGGAGRPKRADTVVSAFEGGRGGNGKTAG